MREGGQFPPANKLNTWLLSVQVYICNVNLGIDQALSSLLEGSPFLKEKIPRSDCPFWGG